MGLKIENFTDDDLASAQKLPFLAPLNLLPCRGLFLTFSRGVPAASRHAAYPGRDRRDRLSDRRQQHREQERRRSQSTGGGSQPAATVHAAQDKLER